MDLLSKVRERSREMWIRKIRREAGHDLCDPYREKSLTKRFDKSYFDHINASKGLV